MAKRLVINCNSFADFIVKEMAKDGFVVSDIKGVPGREVITFKNSEGEIATAECGFTPAPPSNYRVKLKTMDDKDFVSFETAKRLKEAGFSEKVTSVYAHVYKGEDGWRLRNGYIEDDYNHYEWLNISAPTLWQAQKWLREEKEIEVSVAWCRRRKSYYYWYGELFCPDEDVKFGYDFPSYEAALSAGIDAALNLIIGQK